MVVVKKAPSVASMPPENRGAELGAREKGSVPLAQILEELRVIQAKIVARRGYFDSAEIDQAIDEVRGNC